MYYLDLVDASQSLYEYSTYLSHREYTSALDLVKAHYFRILFITNVAEYKRLKPSTLSGFCCKKTSILVVLVRSSPVNFFLFGKHNRIEC